jgi:Amt family ammonium transporter
MLNALPAQVALLDHHGTILSVNQGWRLMAAASGESAHLFQAEGTDYVTACDLLRGDLASEAVTLSRGLRSVLSGASETFSLEYRAPPPMQTRWFRLMVVPLVTSGERQIVVMHVDITERKLMELKLHAAMDAAHESSRLKSEFLANISHEIRTPMTSILGYTDLLLHQLNEDISVSLPVALQTIQRNGEHLLQIINDLLDLSKIEAGKFLLDRIAYSPFEILDEVRALMSIRAKGRGLELTFRQNGSLPEKILTDPVRLRQVLINLVGNAIKFTHQGSVTVETTLVQPADAAPHLRFAVIDTGMGIDPAKVAHIFEPFSQADSSTVRNHGGIGLGLAICQRLAAMLGGEIQVNSVPGQGSRFIFTTLTGDLEGVALLEQNRTLHAQVPLAGLPRKALHGRVLLVEDGTDNQRFLSVVLRNAGADVVIAPNGQAACDTVLESRASGRPFDLILMDMQMPVRDGYSATTEIRQGGFRNPIIALTAHAMTDDRERCLRAGCDDYATKPIQKHALIELVGKWLERGLEREQALAISGSKGSPTARGGIHPVKSAPSSDSPDK